MIILTIRVQKYSKSLKTQNEWFIFSYKFDYSDIICIFAAGT
ncbi:hypothetical protein SAMN05216462_0645 [Xylanibacter ruminicola]|uniref:Uncharacterized protein n=1 Tax=Xylanibacter ruminicola TaxID=839 RepID=A0A1H3YGH7_XYLRU|nr:hypothetical protein SAMN05216462_0645 [Xylanibacter ruminicola]